MSVRFLVIPHIRVEHANAMQSWWLMAPPSPMTIHGFVRAMSLKCGFSFSRFALVHHNIQWLSAEVGNSRFLKNPDGGREDKNWDFRFWNKKVVPQQHQGATYIDTQDHIDSGFAKGLQPTARCHTEMSVIIDVGESPVILDAVKNFLWSGRLGGGAIVSHGHAGIKDKTEDVMKSVRGGFWVVDRHGEVLDQMRVHGIDGTEALIKTLGENAHKTSIKKQLDDLKDDPKEDHDNAWISANVTGFAALEIPASRLGVRNNLPHAYAEPLVGLVQYCSVHKESIEIPFWQYQSNPEKGIYLVQGV